MNYSSVIYSTVVVVHLFICSCAIAYKLHSQGPIESLVAATRFSFLIKIVLSVLLSVIDHACICPFILNPLDVLRSYEARVHILEEEVKSMEADKLKTDMERNTAYKEVLYLSCFEQNVASCIVFFAMPCNRKYSTANQNTERLL